MKLGSVFSVSLFREKSLYRNKNREAYALENCYHPCALSTVFILQSPQDCRKCLAGEDKEYINGDSEPLLVVLGLRYRG